MKKAKMAGWGLAAALLVLIVSTLAYYLPATVKVTISGTEIKRQDIDSSATPPRTRDVRYILTQDIETKESRVFRNEDTGWGWPPYLKFDSGNITGEAANLAKSESETVVLVTYYGLRSTVLSLYPNAVSLKVVDRNASHLPWFNIIFSVLLVAALIAGYIFFRRLRGRITRWWQARRGGPSG